MVEASDSFQSEKLSIYFPLFCCLRFGSQFLGEFSVLPSFHNSLELFSMKPQGMLYWKPKFRPPRSGYVKDKLGRARVAHSDGIRNTYYLKLKSLTLLAPPGKKEISSFQVLFLLVLSMTPEAHRPVWLGSCHSHGQGWGPPLKWPGLTRNELRIPWSEMISS